MKMTTRSQL